MFSSAGSEKALFAGGLTDALNEGPVFLSKQVRSEVFLSSDVLRTSEVQIYIASHILSSE